MLFFDMREQKVQSSVQCSENENASAVKNVH